MKSSPEIAEIAAALANAQPEIEAALKESYNPHFRAKYADISNIIASARPALATVGVSILQFPEVADDRVTVETRLLHSSGQWISGEVSIPTSKWDAQGVGSAITYARRYGLQSILAIPTDDDDGDGASDATRQQQGAEASTKEGAEFKRRLEEAAAMGTDALKKVWGSSTKELRLECNVVFGQLKEVAAQADKSR